MFMNVPLDLVFVPKALTAEVTGDEFSGAVCHGILLPQLLVLDISWFILCTCTCG